MLCKGLCISTVYHIELLLDFLEKWYKSKDDKGLERTLKNVSLLPSTTQSTA